MTKPTPQQFEKWNSRLSKVKKAVDENSLDSYSKIEKITGVNSSYLYLIGKEGLIKKSPLGKYVWSNKIPITPTLINTMHIISDEYFRKHQRKNLNAKQKIDPVVIAPVKTETREKRTVSILWGALKITF